jgi:hypothetical protein
LASLFFPWQGYGYRMVGTLPCQGYGSDSRE